VPNSLNTGDPYECTFSAVLPPGNAGTEHTNTITAAASGGAVATAEATVTYEDVKPDDVRVTKWGNPGILNEPGGDVDYIVSVENLGEETIFLGALTDDIFGDLNGQGDCVISETPILGGEKFECTFTGAVSGLGGDEHTNTVTALIHDDEDNLRFFSDDFKVSIVDELPTVTVAYTAVPNSVEPGNIVTFTIEVSNDNVFDDVLLVDLDDTVFGDLKSECSFASPVNIPPGDTWSCILPRLLNESHMSTVTALVKDIDSSETVEESADVSVYVVFRLLLPLVFNNGS
jgi:hypothetical protein